MDFKSLSKFCFFFLVLIIGIIGYCITPTWQISHIYKSMCLVLFCKVQFQSESSFVVNCFPVLSPKQPLLRVCVSGAFHTFILYCFGTIERARPCHSVVILRALMNRYIKKPLYYISSAKGLKEAIGDCFLLLIFATAIAISYIHH